MLENKAADVDHVVTTGRTHLMDTMPVRLGQELGGWASQVRHGIGAWRRRCPAGGTGAGRDAVGTGISTHPEFGVRIAAKLAEMTGGDFVTSPNYFESLSAQDAAGRVERAVEDGCDQPDEESPTTCAG